MATPNHKYWVNGTQPFGKGHLAALCRYSPEAKAKGTLKACSLKSVLTFYTPEKPTAGSSLLAVPRHFVRVPSTVTEEKMEKIMSKAHRIYEERARPGPRTAAFYRR